MRLIGQINSIWDSEKKIKIQNSRENNYIDLGKNADYLHIVYNNIIVDIHNNNKT